MIIGMVRKENELLARRLALPVNPLVNMFSYVSRMKT
jgi:hypothetical protein